MGNKKSSRGNPKSVDKKGAEKKAQSAANRSKIYYIAPALAAVVGVGSVLALKNIYADKPSQPGSDQVKSESHEAAPYKRREVRPTMSPSAFGGVVAATYQIARDIPEVLDQIYCYCMCKENFGHLSLLTCYLDRHAAQ